LRGFRCQNLAISKQPKHKNPNLAQRLTSYSRPTQYLRLEQNSLPPSIVNTTVIVCLTAKDGAFWEIKVVITVFLRHPGGHSRTVSDGPAARAREGYSRITADKGDKQQRD
jgi:hypothetical protein